MPKNIELLAPAGSFDALVAAVQNGADAVYIGGNKFNARQYANNFDEQSMIKAIDYAHLYGVKVYITLNTLIKTKELDKLRGYIEFLYANHIDGIIIQDLGVAHIISRDFPGLPMHGSTQMTVHNIEGVQMLQNLGFKRVVLSRELTLDEISYISDHSDIELEIFIHGALCICYSGQCLMSSVIGGRSGNRGMCAQPCRLPYGLIEYNKEKKLKTEGYLMSPKDLCSYDFFSNVLKSGVTSLKIEGRMKRPEYVAVVTREYRKMLDSDYSSKGKEELMQIFNRGGFSNGYYFGTKNRDMICNQKPNNWGLYLGDVENQKKDWIDISLKNTIQIGDGIEFWIDDGKNCGQTVSRIRVEGKDVNIAQAGQKVSIETKKRLKRGVKIWRTSSISQLNFAKESFKNPYGRKIPISMKGRFEIGEMATLFITDDKHITGIGKSSQYVEIAKKRPVTMDDIVAQLSKLGDTPFELMDIDIDADKNIFMPISEINKLRRMATDELIKKRIISATPIYCNEKNDGNKQNTIGEKEMEKKPNLFLYTDELIDDKNILELVDGIVLCPNNWRFDFGYLKEILNLYKAQGIVTRLMLPRITRMEDINFLNNLDVDIWSMFDQYGAGNIGMIEFLQHRGINNIIVDFSLNVFNNYSIRLLEDMGIKGVVLSPELNINEIRDITSIAQMPCEIITFGRIPLMITEHCPVGNDKKDCKTCSLKQGDFRLIDRKNAEFPLRRTGIYRCYTEILNSKILFVADKTKDMLRTEVDIYGIYGFEMDKEDVANILRLHRFMLDNPKAEIPDDMKGIVSRIQEAGFTRGHFFRGVE